jgi:hypothetical protein
MPALHPLAGNKIFSGCLLFIIFTTEFHDSTHRILFWLCWQCHSLFFSPLAFFAFGLPAFTDRCFDFPD